MISNFTPISTSVTDDEPSTDEEWELLQPTMRNLGTQQTLASSNNISAGSRSLNSYDAWASNYINFTNENPTTFHAIAHFAAVLENAGFTYLPEDKELTSENIANLNMGGLFYTTRGGVSLVAFAIGGQWTPGNGVGVIGSHVDCITKKIKPFSQKSDIDGYKLLGVAPYSSSHPKLWLDRDLGLGGRIIIKDEQGRITTKTIKSDYPVAKIPSLAEHFINYEHQIYNSETKMVPIIGYTTEEESEEESIYLQNLVKQIASSGNSIVDKHSIHLLQYVSEISQVPIERILELDLELYDTQAAQRGGLQNEFIFAPRVDDRLCAFTSIHALVQFSEKTPLHNYDGCNMVLLCDNEEIGSATRTGVKGKLLNATVDRILYSKNQPLQDFITQDLISGLASHCFANSIIVSADVTHLFNPNFKSAYLEGHFPLPNTGLTLKKDANMHVMTDSIGISLFETIAKKNNLKLQQFQIRNGAPSGGTIGPMIACDTGARTVDVGLPQLSMHSIRAMFGYKDVQIGIDTFLAFFRDWRGTYNNYKNV